MHPAVDKMLRKLQNVCNDFKHGKIDLTTARERMMDILRPRPDDLCLMLGREPTDKEIRLLASLMLIYAAEKYCEHAD